MCGCHDTIFEYCIYLETVDGTLTPQGWIQESLKGVAVHLNNSRPNQAWMASTTGASFSGAILPAKCFRFYPVKQPFTAFPTLEKVTL